MSLESLEQVEKFHVLVNPGSTAMTNRHKQGRVKAQLRELAQSRYGSRLPRTADDYIYTHQNPVETAKRLDAKIQANAIVLVVGGDGTGHNWTNASRLHAQSPHVQGAACVLMGGGFADDGPLALNSRAALLQPSTILDSGRLVAFQPIEWQFTHADNTEPVLTNLYGTLGGSAAAAQELNQPENRKASYAGKAWISYHAMRRMPLLTIQEGAHSVRALFELGLGNSRTMGGFEDCFPFSLTDPDIFRYELATRRILSSTVRFKLGRVAGEPLKPPLQIRLCSEAVWQGDGEPRELPPGTNILAQAFAHTVEAFSTRLNSPQDGGDALGTATVSLLQ